MGWSGNNTQMYAKFNARKYYVPLKLKSMKT